MAGLDARQGFHPACPRHGEVHEHEIEITGFERLGFLQRCRLPDLDIRSQAEEQPLQALSEERMVIDDEDVHTVRHEWMLSVIRGAGRG